MKVRGSGGEGEKIEPAMAPMIDVVFQLLIFFMLTLKIIEPEGDFSINMPQGKPQQSKPTDATIDPVVITMAANDDGTLNAVQFGGNQAMAPSPSSDPEKIQKFIEDNKQEFPGYDKMSASEKEEARRKAAMRVGEEALFKDLNAKIDKFVDSQKAIIDDPEKLEKELKAKISFSYGLHYRYLIKATSACRGIYVIQDDKRVRKDLIKNIEFIRPATPTGSGG